MDFTRGLGIDPNINYWIQNPPSGVNPFNKKQWDSDMANIVADIIPILSGLTFITNHDFEFTDVDNEQVEAFESLRNPY